MALNTRNRRAAAQGRPGAPMLPEATGEVIDKEGRHMVVGVYPVDTGGVAPEVDVILMCCVITATPLWLNEIDITSKFINEIQVGSCN